MKYIRLFFASSILISININCTNGDKNPPDDPTLVDNKSGIPAPTTLSFAIIAQYPHDTAAYTQGLQLYKGKMYEGTGDYENSSLRIVDWKTGIVEKKHAMGNADIFGEGITILNGKIYQLTWESNIVYVYDINNIDKSIATFNWPYEGWGITHNDSNLIVSDGSANLYIVDPANFKVKSTVAVKDNYGAVSKLNELEFVNGYVYANIYGSGFIVKIDPESGHVKGRIDLSNLLPQNSIVPGRTDVLNGIAYDSTSGNFLVTGKRWPKMYEMKLN